MKTRILFSLIIVISACELIAAQNPSTRERPRRALTTETTPGDADPQLKEVTLYWFHKSDRPFPPQPDDSRSSVNFETGERGPSRGGAFDMRYGGMILGVPNKPGLFLADWLGVLDCRSKIIDLGAKAWEDFKATPPLPHAEDLRAPLAAQCSVVVDNSYGAREISPYQQMVVPKSGHVYFMMRVNGNQVSYLLFRVQSVKSRESCVISWKLVKPPNVDDREK